MTEQIISIFSRGCLIGFSIAAPVGPIGVLCVRRTLAKGFASGFVSGIGAASADAIYGALAAFGLTFITNFLVAQDNWFRLIGGLFLCYLGTKNALEKPTSLNNSHIGNTDIGKDTRIGRQPLVTDYASTFVLTLTNPLTILSFAAIFGGLGLAERTNNPTAAVFLVTGVFTGSVLWWLLLTNVSTFLREKFITSSGLRWINIISGGIIFLFGLAALASIATRIPEAI